MSSSIEGHVQIKGAISTYTVEVHIPCLLFRCLNPHRSCQHKATTSILKHTTHIASHRSITAHAARRCEVRISLQVVILPVYLIISWKVQHSEIRKSQGTRSSQKLQLYIRYSNIIRTIHDDLVAQPERVLCSLLLSSDTRNTALHALSSTLSRIPDSLGCARDGLSKTGGCVAHC